MKVWEGRKWRENGRILILGESWYGDDSLEERLTNWTKEKPDYLFSRVFNACSGQHTDTASQSQRSAFWETVSFTNFVCWSVGAISRSRPTAGDYEGASRYLPDLIRDFQPAGVWILGVEQGKYSKSIIRALGIAEECVRHPRSGVSNAELKSSWHRLHKQVRDLPLAA